MPFVIYEQGVRIATPPNRIFPPRTVAATSAIGRAKPVAGHEEAPIAPYAPAKHINDYQQVEEEARHRVRTAEEIMTHPVQTLLLSDTVATAWRVFQQFGFRHIPVTDAEQRLVGIVADRDLWSTLGQVASVGLQTLDTFMQARVITATGDTEIRVLAGAMAEHHIGGVPIVDPEGHVRGIVTRTDILRVMVNQAPLELWV